MLAEVVFSTARLRFDFEDRRDVDAPVVVLLAASVSGMAAVAITLCFKSGSFISILLSLLYVLRLTSRGSEEEPGLVAVATAGV